MDEMQCRYNLIGIGRFNTPISVSSFIQYFILIAIELADRKKKDSD